MRAIVLAAALLGLSACSNVASPADDTVEVTANEIVTAPAETATRKGPPMDAIRIASRTTIPDADLVILRDPTTGCDYVQVDAYQAQAVTPRTRDGQVVCDGTPARGFEIVSAVNLANTDVTRLRDVGTGCLFLHLHEYQDAAITPVYGRDGRQDCGRR